MKNRIQSIQNYNQNQLETFTNLIKKGLNPDYTNYFITFKDNLIKKTGWLLWTGVNYKIFETKTEAKFHLNKEV